MLRRIIDAINRHRTFLITSHVRPDGDAVGSELALYHILNDMGKEALIYNQDKTPDNYGFLPGSSGISRNLPDPAHYEVVFVLDCSELDRIGGLAAWIGSMKRIVNIDHHVSNSRFCELAYIDPQASSTGEMIHRLMMEMAVVPTKDVANCLYAALITDTGGFRYRNTGRDTLLAAANLVENGADPQWLAENIYENNPLEKIRLLARTLKTMTFDLNGRVASMVVTLEALAATGALSEHIEGFVDVPRSIRGVEVSVLYLEVDPDNYKLSLRSKGKVNVEKVAGQLGGGGHVNASACNMTGNLEEIKRRVVEVIGTVL